MTPVQLRASYTSWTYLDLTRFVASIDSRWVTSAAPPLESFGKVVELLKNQEEEILSLPQGQTILAQFPANPQNPLFYFQREKWLDAYNKIQFWKHLPGGTDYLTAHPPEELEEWMVSRPEVLALKSLKIDRGSMTRLPPEIGLCQQLTHFMMMNSLLRELPREFGNLINLEVAFLSNNRLRRLPPELQNLQKLERLELANNRLESIDPVGLLRNLNSLHVSKNQIRTVPSHRWGKLETLDLGDNQITELSEDFYQMPSLTLLMLNHNQLTKISEKLVQLSKLDSLFLEHNQLTFLPSKLGPKLRCISFSDNQVSEIPFSFANAPSLTEIVFRGNPLQHRPPFIPAKILTFL